MASLIKQFTFVAATTIAPNQVNANFDDIITFINQQVVHKDGTVAMTAPLELPNADPTSANQAARKSYVDAQASGASGAAAAASAAAAAAQASANTALDRTDNKVRWGVFTGGTNGAGDIVIPHGLGATPDAIVLTPFTGGTTVNWQPVVENRDSANINVRIYRTNAAGVIASTPGFSIFWFAGV